MTHTIISPNPAIVILSRHYIIRCIIILQDYRTVKDDQEN